MEIKDFKIFQSVSQHQSISKAAKSLNYVQSHVTFGYVGGKAAVFPLQCLGFDVDVS